MKILVILSVGNEPAFQFSPKENRPYDLWVHYYGTTPMKHDEFADFYRGEKGFKYSFAHEMSQRKEITKYDYILLPDDDLTWDAEKIVKACRLMEQFRLVAAQPTIRQGTCYHHAVTRQSMPVGRKTDFVDIMSPIFSLAAFRKVAWSFKESKSGWGLDNIWAHELEGQKMGVFDCISLEHIRKQFHGEIYPALDAAGVNAGVEAARIFRQYPSKPRKALESLTKDNGGTK